MKESLKKAVRERARFCCEYCLAQSEFSADNFSIEHIFHVQKEEQVSYKTLLFLANPAITTSLQRLMRLTR